MNNQKKKRIDSAVSPVIGVLLMLVVTIIIAAVVSGFAGGLAAGQSKPPVATLDVQIHASENAGAYPPYGSGYYIPTMVIKHLSGDSIATKNTKIVTFFKNESDGKVYQGELSGEVAIPGNNDWNSYDSATYISPLYINDNTRFPDVTSTTTTGLKSWFGNASAILRSGDILVTSHGYCGNYNDNVGPDAPHVNVGLNNLTGLNCTDPVTGFTTGAQITVKVIDIPSGKAIFDKEVTIQ
jgi:archaeal type IV pilus assembly protein PilA